jgi:hypothetical protein
VGRTFKRAGKATRGNRVPATSNTGLFDLTPGEEEQMIADLVAELADEVVRPAAAAADEECRAPDELLKATLEVGLPILGVPEELGGIATERSAVTGVLVHESGALSTLVMSFDAIASHASRIEVHGDLASMVVPDPNGFGGDVQLRTLADTEWQTLEPSGGYVDSSRGYGLADLATTAPGSEPRAGGKLAYHVLDVMESLLASAHSGVSVTVQSTCERPPAVPLSSAPGGLRP